MDIYCDDAYFECAGMNGFHKDRLEHLGLNEIRYFSRTFGRRAALAGK